MVQTDPNSADSDPGLDAIRRVAFVTNRFHELRGFIPAVFGVALIVAASVEHIAGTASSRSSFAMFQPLNFAQCVNLLAMIALDRAYRHTFGNAVGTRRQKLLAGLPTAVVLLGGMIDIVYPAALSGPSVMAVAFAIYAIWIVSRDWPWRIHYVPAAVAGVAAAILTATVPAGALDITSANPVRVEVHLLAWTVIGLALVYAGLCDHRLLVASMHVGATASSQERARSRGTFEIWTMAVLFAVAGTLLLWLEPGTATQTLPLVLGALVIAYQVIVAVPAALRAIREFSGDGRVTEPSSLRLDLHGERLVAMFAVALAAALESTFAVKGLIAVTLAIAIAWTAVRTRPIRPLYLLAACIFGVAAVLSRTAEPAEALGILMIAISVAAMLKTLSDHRIGNSDAHTV